MKKISLKLILFTFCISFLTPNEFCLAKSSKSEGKEERREIRREKYRRKISKLRGTEKREREYVTRVEPSISSKQLPITILIYAQNAANWVTKNLDSVLKQQYQNYRIIYINDASTDDMDTKLEEYIHY